MRGGAHLRIAQQFVGRVSALIQHAPKKTTLYFFHGKSYPAIQFGHCVTAAERLGGDITADVIPFLTDEVNEEVMDRVLERFTGHIPKHQWEEVQMAAAAEQPSVKH